MKKIYSAFVLLSMLSGCASTHVYESPPQFYRAKGQESQTKITGKVEQFQKNNIHYQQYSNKVIIYFNGSEQISGYLDHSMFGEFNGEQFDGKDTSAACSAKTVAQNWAELKCIVFIDNERAATLIM